MSIRAAYADPPYLGCAQKHYGHLHKNAGDYDKLETHCDLIARMCNEFDCWALSTHEPALIDILQCCPRDVRVCAWVKPFASFKPNVTRAWTWEPVIFWFRHARPRTREQSTWRDHISEPITLRRGFTGAKPFNVCCWIFEGLNLNKHDEFHDLFPGSNAVCEAWNKWKTRHDIEQMPLFTNEQLSRCATARKEEAK